MIRWNRPLAALALAALALAGCSDSQQLPTEPTAGFDQPVVTAPTFDALVLPTATPVKMADLFAGQDTDVGDVFVSNDADYVHVEFTIDPGWCMTESHASVVADVADFPQKNGNPIPGKFEKKSEYTECTDTETYAFDLADLGVGAGDPVHVAVHAVVWEKASETTDWFVSEAGDDAYGPLAAYAPLDGDWGTMGSAVAAWVHPNWPGISGATWISTAEYVEEPVNDSWRKFTKVVPVPGWPLDGGISEATSDNAEEVYFNGTMIGSDGEVTGTATDNREWETIKSYPFAPMMGDNDLSFIVRNYAQAGGTATSNPTGLIFKGFVTYYSHEETAWAGTAVGTTPFDGDNWATYFTYTLQGVCPAAIPSDGFVAIAPPASVASGASEHLKAQLFEEGVTTVPSGATVDEGTIVEGDLVCTYYLHADALGASLTDVDGSVAFEEDILAVAYTGSEAITNTQASCQGVYRLYETDGVFGYSGTIYPPFASTPHRGLECGAQDAIHFQSPSSFTVTFELGVAEATDGIRIFLPALP